MERYRVSRYLQVIPRDKDFAVYHSLFGKLALLNAEGYELLRGFVNPRTIEDIRAEFGQRAFDLDAYLNELGRRYFLVPDGFDEYTYVEQNRQKREEKLASGYLVRALQLITSNHCNFRCKYCFVDSMYDSQERAEYQQSPTNKQMSNEVAEEAVSKLVALLKQNGHKALFIEFFGGEPLMNWPVMRYVLEHFQNGDAAVQIRYSVTTNGSLITDEMAEVMKKYGVTVTISFDSPEGTERVLADGRNGMDLVKKGIEILQKHGNWVTFNSVLSKESMDSFNGKELIDFAVDHGIKMVGLILDLDLEFYEADERKAELLEKLWETYHYAESRGLPVVGYWHQIFNQIVGKQALNLFSGYKTCPATGCKLSVEPEGHVFICKCCSGYLGEIADLETALHTDLYKEYSLRAYRNAPECAGCEIEGFCSGVCMGSLEKKYHSLHGIEQSSCDVFKAITKKLIENFRGGDAYNLYTTRFLRTAEQEQAGR